MATSRTTSRRDIRRELTKYNQAIERRPRDPRAYSARAAANRRLGRYADALHDYQLALRLDADFLPAMLGQATVHRLQGDYDAAHAQLDRAAEVAPEDANIYTQRGHVFSAAGDDERALQEHRRALQIDAARPGDLFAEAEIFLKQDNLTAAGAYLDKVIEIAPQVAAAYQLRSVTNYKLGNLEAAVEDGRRLVQLEPENAIAWHNGGVALFDLERYDEAIEFFDRAIGLTKANARSVNYRGRAYIKIGKPKEALRDLEKLARAGAPDADTLEALGEAYFTLKNYRRSIDYDTRALNRDGDRVMAYFRRGVASLAEKDFEQAMLDLTQAILLRPDLGRAYAERAQIHNMRGDRTRVKNDLDAAIRHGVADDVTLTWHASLAAEEGEFEAALVDLSKVLEQFPDRSAVRLQRAQVAFKAEQFKQAAADFAQVARERPNDAGLVFNYGSACLEMGEYEKARKAFTRAIETGLRDAATFLARAEAGLKLGDSLQAERDCRRAKKLAVGNDAITAMADELLRQIETAS